METQDNKFTETKKSFFENLEEKHEAHIARHHSGAGRFFGGLIILAVGIVLLLKQVGTVVFPDWLFTWQMLLVVIGFYSGVRHGFRLGGWIILMLVGGIFLSEYFYPSLNLSDYIWPIVIISVGVLMILRPRRHNWYWGDREYWKNQKWQWKAYYKYGQQPPASGTLSQDDYIDSVSIFGGVHKVIVSKDFKGGDMVNIFGGAEINLSQADIKGVIVLDVVQIFGGAKIIVPSDWTIQSKIVSVFGGVEDKRNPSVIKPNPEKVLIIDGTSIFAGIDILSY
ncbi:MAG: LiaF transmembrane domain-containing protein [Bacteroidia bacterium]